MRGLYIVVEGVDGCGKSTAVTTVASLLAARHPGLEVIVTRHPGATPLGAHIRRLVKNPETIAPDITIDPPSAQMLMAVDHVSFRTQILLPALERGAVVLADRSNLISGIAYGRATGMSYAAIHTVLSMAGGPRIDKLFVIRCPADVAVARVATRGDANDSFERRGSRFVADVATIYNNLVTGAPEQTVLVHKAVSVADIVFVDGAATPASVAAVIENGITEALRRRL